MLKCAMEKIQRIETRLHLPPNKPSSSERLVLRDASNAYSPPPLNIWTSQEDLEGSVSEIDDSLEKQEAQEMLITPTQVVLKYKALQVPSKFPKLAVKLAREAYFGENMMNSCTVRGTRGQKPLPADGLESMKSFLRCLSVPKIFTTQVDFEECWKACLISVGQACKNSRLKKK